MKIRFMFIVIIAAIVMAPLAALADHMHTHIGRNADGVWGNADDDALWVFATPTQPQWPTMEMTPTGDIDPLTGREIYVAELDCWHSAHPETGAFQLGGPVAETEGTAPTWSIAIERVSFSDPVNFWMEEESTGLSILDTDGDVFNFGSPAWFADKYDGAGELGAYGFHVHTEFLAAPEYIGQIFSATFRAIDESGVFSPSDTYTLTFQAVPEPLSMVMLGLGAVVGYKRRRA